MSAYVLRRALISVVVIWLVITLVFLATNVLSGDFATQRYAAQGSALSDTPAQREARIQAARAEFGLDEPVPVRYVHYLSKLARGDLGRSYQTRRSVIGTIGRAAPYTLQLSAMTLIVAVLASLPFGILMAVWKDSSLDRVLRVVSSLFNAAPSFWTASVALVVVTRWQLWTVDFLGHPLLFENPVASLKLFGLPALFGGLGAGSGLLRLVRSQVLDVLHEDYMRTARAKGLRERAVILRHGLRNALLPVVTVLGFAVGGLLAGNVIMESLFAIPGLGNHLVTAVSLRDLPMVQSLVLLSAILVVAANFAVDLLYTVIDPRLQLN